MVTDWSLPAAHTTTYILHCRGKKAIEIQKHNPILRRRVFPKCRAKAAPPDPHDRETYLSSGTCLPSAPAPGQCEEISCCSQWSEQLAGSQSPHWSRSTSQGQAESQVGTSEEAEDDMTHLELCGVTTAVVWIGDSVYLVTTHWSIIRLGKVLCCPK